MLSRVPKNPFKVLGVSPSSSFETIQKKFNELALKYHPDSSSSASSSPSTSISSSDATGATTDNDATTSSGGRAAAAAGGGGDASQFIRIRQAFEYIRKTTFDKSSSGFTLRRHTRHGHGHHHHHHQNHTFSETDFLDYFFEQTGVRLSSSQRREMIDLYRSRTPGYYGGHSWDIARRLSFEQDSYLARMKEYQDTINDDDDIFQKNSNNDHSRSSTSSSNNNSSEDINDDGKSSSNNSSNRRRKRRR